MKKLNLAIVFIIISFLCNGQAFTIKGKVLDQEDEAEIPYVNIYVLNHKIGTSSNSSGVFELELNNSLKNDSLIFSSTGYQSKRVAISSVSNGIIKLVKQIYSLQEITISPLTQNRGSIVINRFNGKNCFIQYSPIGDKGIWIPSRPKEPTIEAFFFPFKEKYSRNNYVKEVWLYMSNYKTSTSCFLLRFFRPNKIGEPGDDMLAKPIKVEVTKSHSMLKVDLSKYNLSLYEEGLFVGVELLIIDENKCLIEDKGRKISTLYSPFLNYVKTKDEVCYWLYSKGIWNRQQKKVIGGDIITRKAEPNRYLKPSISLIIRN